VESGPAPHCGSLLGVVKYGWLLMASETAVGRGIHLSGSLLTCLASLVRFHHVRPSLSTLTSREDFV
jgi:hypothetical protein